MKINLNGPGITHWKRNAAGAWEFDPIIRNPYDLSTWGAECGRGCEYKNTGTVVDGAANQRRSISSGRKSRGSSFTDFQKQEGRNGKS
jgi:hypothetical protein